MAFRISLALAAALLLLAPTVWSQAYEGRPCQQPGNPRLKAMLTAGNIDRLETFAGYYGLWSTTFLAPSGKAPPKPTSEEFEAQEDYQVKLVAWACQYSAERAQDADTATAWVEGVAGHGVGEIMIAQVNTQRPVQIWAGYGKSPALHAANSRPRKVRVQVLQATREPDYPQINTVYFDLKILATAEVELRDVNGYQPLPLPAHQLRQIPRNSGGVREMDDSLYQQVTFVALEILSVYPGTKYQDTAITEVQNVPAN